MRISRRGLCLAACLMAASTTAEQAADDTKAGLEPYPLEYWAMRPVIRNVAVSPDGKHLALMKIPSKDGDPIIEVYDAADLTKEPFRLDADPMEITGFYWASDQDILFTLRQKVRERSRIQQGVYEFPSRRAGCAPRDAVVRATSSHPSKRVGVAVRRGTMARRSVRPIRPLASTSSPATRYPKLIIGQCRSSGQLRRGARGSNAAPTKAVASNRLHRKPAVGVGEIHRHGTAGFDVDIRTISHVVRTMVTNGGLCTFNVDNGADRARSSFDVDADIFDHSNVAYRPVTDCRTRTTRSTANSSTTPRLQPTRNSKASCHTPTASRSPADRGTARR